VRAAVVTGILDPPAIEDGRELAGAFLGRAAQAILLDCLRREDGAAASALHDAPGPRPYTAAATVQAPFGDDESWRVRLRFTVLEPWWAERLPTALQRLPAELCLDRYTARVEAVALTPAEDRDAGTSSFQEILNRHLLASTEPSPRVGLRFLTPTAFHQGDRNQPLPLPELVFGGLVDRWNAFSRLTLSPDARRFAEECLAVSQFRLESRVVDLAGGRQIGGVGTAIYRALRADSYWLRVLGALADFAFYAGVGAKTTMGLGQTRRLPLDRPRPRADSPPSPPGRTPVDPLG
jgi:CRISPR-associated endoribonuclease Cas6